MTVDLKVVAQRGGFELRFVKRLRTRAEILKNSIHTQKINREETKSPKRVDHHFGQ
jgi:hypothetical protein